MALFYRVHKTMEDTELIQRVGHRWDEYGGVQDLSDLADIDDYHYSDSDNDSDYGADKEDNDEYPEERAKVKDPGPFRYNKKMAVVSLPCAVMVLTLVGEMYSI